MVGWIGIEERPRGETPSEEWGPRIQAANLKENLWRNSKPPRQSPNMFHRQQPPAT